MSIAVGPAVALVIVGVFLLIGGLILCLRRIETVNQRKRRRRRPQLNESTRRPRSSWVGGLDTIFFLQQTGEINRARGCIYLFWLCMYAKVEEVAEVHDEVLKRLGIDLSKADSDEEENVDCISEPYQPTDIDDDNDSQSNRPRKSLLRGSRSRRNSDNARRSEHAIRTESYSSFSWVPEPKGPDKVIFMVDDAPSVADQPTELEQSMKSPDLLVPVMKHKEKNLSEVDVNHVNERYRGQITATLTTETLV